MNYKVRKQDKPMHIVTSVPGSKSITNRALLMAALSKESVTLRGVLFSDDSRHFLASLVNLGFEVDINEENCVVTVKGCGGTIPKKQAEINVGSAGTAARFLTAMLALSDGEYIINSSQQMKKRPMKPLFDALTQMGARFTYLENEGFLPVRVKGSVKPPATAYVDISKSTQFLSALLMISPMMKEGLTINITSDKKTGSYIKITQKMMAEFGCNSEFDGEKYIIRKGEGYNITDYVIEPDLSAACYFYAMAAVTGGSAVVKNVHMDSMQGDLKFLTAVLTGMGCTITDEEEGIRLTAPAQLSGIDVDMNDFSDQTMTLAAIAPFAADQVRIRNIEHIRGQESDRMAAVINELNGMGVPCREVEDGIVITPAMPHPYSVRTYEDHRIAMAFAVTGLKADGIQILDCQCCSKTFENYFEVLDRITVNSGLVEGD